MNATAEKLSCVHEGVDKTSFTDSLQYLSDQIRRMDQTLTVKVEERIGQDFNVQNQDLQHR